MAIYNKFNCFQQDLGRKKHALNSDSLQIMLSNVLPVATNAVKTDITEIAVQNGYVAGGNVAGYVSDNQTAGVYKLILLPPLFTASGGSFGPFQYAVLFNNTSAAKNLIGWYDYGTPITITNGNAFQVNLDQTNGVFSET